MTRPELVAKVLNDVADVFEDESCVEALAKAGTLRDAMANMCRWYALVASELKDE